LIPFGSTRRRHGHRAAGARFRIAAGRSRPEPDPVGDQELLEVADDRKRSAWRCRRRCRCARTPDARGDGRRRCSLTVALELQPRTYAVV